MMIYLLPLILAAAVAPSPTPGEPSQAIDRGRTALRRGGYPWYDGRTDGIRPLDPPAPPAPPARSHPIPVPLPTVADVLIYGILAALLGLLLVGASRAIGRRAAARRPAHASPVPGFNPIEPIEALPFPVRHPVTDLLAEARRCRAAGDDSRAIVYLFSHQLVTLDQHRLIHLAKGKTNRMYAAELQGAPDLGRLFRASMERFEATVFGHHPISRGELDEVWNALDQFDRLVREASP